MNFLPLLNYQPTKGILYADQFKSSVKFWITISGLVLLAASISGLVTPVSVRTVVRFAFLPKTMSVSNLSPNMAQCSGWRPSMRFWIRSNASLDGFPQTACGFFPVALRTDATNAPTPGTVSSRLAMGKAASSFVTMKFAPLPIYEAARRTDHINQQNQFFKPEKKDRIHLIFNDLLPEK